MTYTDLAALLTAATLAAGTIGRGIVWIVQRQSKKTVSPLRTENAALRRHVTRRVKRHRRRAQRRRKR